MNEIFLSPYNPTDTEGKIYKIWEESGFFNPDNLPNSGAEPFTIMMPPPNATGILHMGHALGLTIQDIAIRYKRMQGFKTLWLPGTDHAAIATQAKVEKEISKKESQSRHDLGRDELVKRIEKFVEESRSTIQKQIRVMGASCDWSREAFTFDDARNIAVNTLFKQMYDSNLIYRAHRIVNWDPKGQTTISDDEIVYEERAGKIYTFKYSKDFPISIASTRPETKVGDVAVAVNPDDSRYKEYIGKEYDLVFCDVPIKIKIVADEAADPAFGTGAVGVTPAHSMTDWDIAERNNLPKDKIIINEFAKMSVEGRLNGKKVTEAREMVVEWLKEQNLLEKEEEVKQNIATAERTGGIIEPLPKLQWFVAVNKPIPQRNNKTLKEIMLDPVRDSDIKIIPAYFDKTYFHWIENLRDWCISRQIWYGHQIPVWYKNDEIAVGEKPEGEEWKQDEDTLDTWFSSGSWTFSTLGWPKETPDLKTYHPTDLLVPAYEILFFWVARMILMSKFALDQIPFKTVYLTGIIRDAKGQKFSKSLGNGIDPIDIAKKYGTDAGRMSLVVGNTPGTDMRLDENKIKAYKLFANKLWNITRFVLSSTDGFDGKKPKLLVGTDLSNTTELENLVSDVTKDMENYKFHIASEKLYHYVWHSFADKIIEESKEKLKSADQQVVKSIQYTLLHLLKTSLKMLHPFMPFITEEIWQHMKSNDENMLMVTSWPK